MFNHLKYFIICLSLLLTSANSYAGILTIPNFPLSTESSAVDPNMMFVIDDSGSMDWSVLAPAHYEWCNYLPSAKSLSCNSNIHDNNNFYYSHIYKRWGRTYIRVRDVKYMFKHRNVYSSSAAVDFPDLENTDWRVFEPTFNTLTYNPNSTYTPWDGPCHGDGSKRRPFRKCTDASFSRTRAHPKEGNRDYGSTVNIGRTLANKAKYVIAIDDKKYTGSKPTHDNIADGANGEMDPWDTHAVFNFTSSSRMNVKLVKTDNSANNQTYNQANLSGSACYNVLGPRKLVEDILKGSRSLTSTGAEGCRTVTEVQQNYANWYQYSRRRSLATKNALSYIVSLYPTINYGYNYINDNPRITWPISLTKEEKTLKADKLLHNYFLGRQRAVGTPLIQGLNTTGQYYMGKHGKKPITSECQRNYAVALTDGYWYQSSRQYIKLGDVDGDGYDPRFSTLSDVAYYYYKNDISRLPNKITPLPSNPAKHQHMVTFGISFGVKGKLERGEDGWPVGNLGVSSDWGNPNCPGGQCPEKVDDLWHAAYNSKGAFFQSNSTEELKAGLNEILTQVVSNINGSLSMVATDTKLLTGDPHVYQATFRADKSVGEVTAYKINLDGTIDTANPVWMADKELKNIKPDDRVVLSYANKDGVAFRWPRDYKNPSSTELTTPQINKLLSQVPRSYTNKADYGKDLINFIRGDRTKEQKSKGAFRDREGILGDVLHASPVIIQPPSNIYKDWRYTRFKAQYKNRKNMLAVGANDGMMHILDANTGKELMSYVPGFLPSIDNLPKYAAPDYNHTYFVDATPGVADIQLANRTWMTTLIGSLGRGGQGLFALDLSSGSFSESTASAKKTVMWEFTDKDDPDLGNVFGTPQIVKMSNGKWAAIFGNGYNSTKPITTAGQPDANISKSGQAFLFIVFIENGLDGTWTLGTDYIKIPVGKANANGLSEPFPVDVTGNYSVDYIYAGDLNGELWKFDVRSRNIKEWTKTYNVKKLYSTSKVAGSGQQPITAAPIVTAHPAGLSQGLMVYFGTGKYIEKKDNTSVNQYTQGFYAIWDKNNGSQAPFSGYNKLLKQSIVAATDSLRAVTSNRIDWTQHQGWYIPLMQPYKDPKTGKTKILNHGERINTQPILRNGRVIFVTIVPPDETASTCSATFPESWIMELNAADGSLLSTPPFDVNSDGAFNDSDYITYVDGSNIKVSEPHGGMKSKSGMMGAAPTILTNPKDDTETKIINGIKGMTTEKESVDPKSIGRQSWQQVN